MKNTTRKHIWPMSLVMGLAVIGALAVIVALTAWPGTASAQPANPFADAEPAVTTVDINGWSSSAGGSADLVIRVNSSADLTIDSSFILVLEDDYTVPDSFPSGAVFIKQDSSPSKGARVTASVSIDSEDDAATGDDSHTVQVFIPDMDPTDDGVQGTNAGVFYIVIPKAAGIKMPKEADGPNYDVAGGVAWDGSHKVGYQIRTSEQGYDSGATIRVDAQQVRSKVGLSDEDNARGYNLVVTAKGLNKGRLATAHLWNGPDNGGPDDSGVSCYDVVANGEKIGEKTVGSDFAAAIEIEVDNDQFTPGWTNYICVRDDNSPDNRYTRDPKVFELEPSITATPANVNSGDKVTIKLLDYPQGYNLEAVTLAGRKLWDETGVVDEQFASTRIEFRGDEDGDELIFDMPGGVSGNVEIAVSAEGTGDETTTIDVMASQIVLSSDEVTAYENIIIRGTGFKAKSRVYVGSITIDDKPLDVKTTGLDFDTAANDGVGDHYVLIDSSGRFVAEARVWWADALANSTATEGNPALDGDTYTIEAIDDEGFVGTADITVHVPTVTIDPDVAGPRDYVTISGENWPVSTTDIEYDVRLTIEEGLIQDKVRIVSTDGRGGWTYEHRLSPNLTLGEEHDIVVDFEGYGGDIRVKAPYTVPSSVAVPSPDRARPGDLITVELSGMPVYTRVQYVRINDIEALGTREYYTDDAGNATLPDVLVPAADPGFYALQVLVSSETKSEIAVAQLEILSDATAPGVATPLPDAARDLGDNLSAIFHFNNATKEWTFFDPRPEFEGLNTLTELISGQPYWVLVNDNQEKVDWNGRFIDFTCTGGDCWNLEIW